MNLRYINRIFRDLSWIKILQFSLFCLITLVFLIFWEVRPQVYESLKINAIPSGKILESVIMTPKSAQETQKSLKKITHTSTIAIQVISVDFKKNIKTQAHIESNNQEFRKSVEDYLTIRSGSGMPVFGSKESNNRRIVELINGNFVCTPYTETAEPAMYLNTTGIVHYVCSVPIPPFYGKFTGYITAYISKKPTEADLAAIRQTLNELSIIVYEESLRIKPQK